MSAPLDPPPPDAFDLLATLVAVVRVDGRCERVNAALENALCQSRRKLVQGQALDWFVDPAPLRDALQRTGELMVSRFEATLHGPAPGAHPLPVHVVVSPLERGGARGGVLLEMIEIEQQARQDREERTHRLAREQKELLRNLAHEIKNPLGGIRGAAQLLALEAAARDFAESAEYTDVIIHEADRLQALVDRLLAPHQRALVLGEVNIHEVCERVRAVVLAEFPRGLDIRRDYDASLPELRGDRERLIQALLNIVRNAAQALAARITAGDACITLRTRVARQLTIGQQRFRLAIELQVEDNGPGVLPELRERIFQPLVSGRADGTGLGLALAQTFVQQHEGTIEYESTGGLTRFKLLLPVR
ncbi:MAG TPA: nitrogen regulation protein NR(II) [Ottowia sp.]|nr:nitrogen regulation protein NR(II) [Ottowia sp.]